MRRVPVQEHSILTSRLQALIVEDVLTYLESTSGDIIHQLGPTLTPTAIARATYGLVLVKTGELRSLQPLLLRCR